MKKRTPLWKTNQNVSYGISGPLDEHKRREADHIGNKIFMVLFYLMTLGNLIPFVLAYKYPQVVAVGYPIIIFWFPWFVLSMSLPKLKNRYCCYWSWYVEQEGKETITLPWT